MEVTYLVSRHEFQFGGYEPLLKVTVLGKAAPAGILRILHAEIAPITMINETNYSCSSMT